MHLFIGLQGIIRILLMNFQFLSITVPTCDNFLILGDFNIHVCCPSKPLASEILQLIESFNFTQFVSGSTHRAGHTLDLVLSLGLSVTNVVVNYACFSDHLFVCFDAAFPKLNSVSNRSGNRSGYSTRLINTSTVDTFSEALFCLFILS